MKPMKNIPKAAWLPTFTPYPRRTTWRSNETWGALCRKGLTSTCGVPYGHVHLAIADDDGCVLTEAESEGWLHIAGDGVASGYLGPHGWEATRRAFVPRTWLDGVTRTWYATGDRAKVRKDGRLVLLGRGAGAGRVKIRGKLVSLFLLSCGYK